LLQVVKESLKVDSIITRKKNMKLAVVECAIYSIGRDAAPASKDDCIQAR
jgi:hypothetical protein